ncbi:cupin domain-containing protein [Microbacterium sp. ARD32]|uniref:cupin domain-containing protein n=1 Tax=Microbacterium sp. ARD32 TaxID=2962577 RepID=UPI0028815C6F|nr:cupin domain-containing protein [Microbacterium sp. ARD32]MDT0158528.1 cupin domain-containing protein [Microbacterium sp. ARD32]
MSQDLGGRIRVARLERGKSLRAVAADASISPSLLSQVETGKVQPSVSTLYAVVASLGLSMDEVLGRRERPTSARRAEPAGPVQPREEGPEVVMENGVTWRGLATMRAGDGIDAVLATYQPGASSSVDETHMRHSGVEYGYVIRGRLTLRLEFETYTLRAGDSLCFDSTRPHLYHNDTDEIAEGIWFVIGMNPADHAGSDEIRSAMDVLHLIGRRPGRVTD